MRTGASRTAASALLWIPSAVTYLVLTAVIVSWWPAMAILVLLTRPFDRDRQLATRFLRLGVVLVAGSFPLWRLRVEGRWPSDRRAYVVVANHTANADIAALCRLPSRMKWMIKATGFRVPVMGWIFGLAGYLPVHDGDAGAALRTLQRAKGYLRRGVSVMVFPEGRRSGGRLLRFKSGAFRLAADTGTAVLPVAISGTDAGSPLGSLLLRPAVLRARILEPIEPREAPVADARGWLRDEARKRIAAALDGAALGGAAHAPFQGESRTGACRGQ